ncbi:MAG: colanic acid biosynthesis acetyltransferase WcaF [Planctomycetes bacterium RBG_13_63_9]|nr:MAG: colanic acid biosynthesis acetyltransferase WcaF [Planctomycetes bacterium RBG_13_63_9]
MDLASFDNREYDPGRGVLVRSLWYLLSLLVFESGWVPLYRPKAWILRLFGAKIGVRLALKPHVRIKYPWRLVVGDYCCIGQGAWIDNLVDVQLGSHVCLSQQAYVCTGSHDYRRKTFDLIVQPIRVGNGAWLGAGCLVLPGVTVGANAVVGAGSVVTEDVPAARIVVGNPARPLPQERTPPT